MVRQLVPEFRPFNGDVLVVMAVLGMLAWRALRNAWDIKVIYTPIFILAIVSWALGFVVARVWLDWGIPALCVWMALEFEDYSEKFYGFLIHETGVDHPCGSLCLVSFRNQ